MMPTMLTGKIFYNLAYDMVFSFLHVVFVWVRKSKARMHSVYSNVCLLLFPGTGFFILSGVFWGQFIKQADLFRISWYS